MKFKEHIKKYWLAWLIGIAIVITVFVKWDDIVAWISGKAIKSKGTIPNPADCGGGKTSRESGCTKPEFSIPVGAEQRCWTFEEIGFEPKAGTSVFTIEGFFATKKVWYYNYQAGNKYCFTDVKCCKGLPFPSNPKNLDEYFNPCGEWFFYDEDNKRWQLVPNLLLMYINQDCTQNEN